MLKDTSSQVFEVRGKVGVGKIYWVFLLVPIHTQMWKNGWDRQTALRVSFNLFLPWFRFTYRKGTFNIFNSHLPLQG